MSLPSKVVVTQRRFVSVHVLLVAHEVLAIVEVEGVVLVTVRCSGQPEVKKSAVWVIYLSRKCWAKNVKLPTSTNLHSISWYSNPSAFVLKHVFLNNCWFGVWFWSSCLRVGFEPRVNVSAGTLFHLFFWMGNFIYVGEDTNKGLNL